MGFYESITLVVLFAGVLVIVLSFFITNIRPNHYEKDREILEALEASKEDLNTKLLELNDYGEYLRTELESKHKELLFLYQLIQEKERKVKAMTADAPIEASGSVVIEATPSSSTTEQILKLYESGLDIETIAKRLDVGQGQVQLVLTLYR